MSEQKNPPLILIDGSSYLFRAYHALPPLTNADGIPTGAMYGVLNMLRKLINSYQPTHIAVVFDCKEKTFRHTMYPEYKANRPAMPEELAVQIAPLYQMIQDMGLSLLKQPGVEADDIIGTLVKRAEKQGYHCLISTGDKDFAQLVNEKTTLINTMTNSTMDINGVEKKFGVKPEQIIDYLALMGDKVDNVPGVNKVGPKTACKWINNYDTLENIIKHADEFSGKVGEYLRESLEQLPLSKQLVTIKTDVELSCTLNDLKPQAADNAALRTAFQTYGFKRWLTELENSGPNKSNSDTSSSTATNNKEKTTTKSSYKCITTIEELQHWVDIMKKADYFAFDTETTSLNPRQAQLVGISISAKPGQAAYIPIAHTSSEATTQLPIETVLQELKPLLQDKNRTIVGHNLKYDVEVMAQHNSPIHAKLHDTMLQDYTLDSNPHSRKLDDLVEKYLQHEMITFQQVTADGKKSINFAEVSIAQATAYAAEDADYTLRLYLYLQKKLNKLPQQQHLLEKIEWPLVHVLSAMETHGVLIDSKLLQQQSERLKKNIEQLKVKIYKLSKTEFNIDSPKQLQNILFNEMHLPIIKKTPKGQPSTAEDVLQTLALDHAIAKHILEYRSLSKLKSTYTDKLPEEVDANTGRIHTSYNQTGTATGRLSSSNPNLQNIPIRSTEGQKIRQAFIAKPKHVLIAADYSQVELRIMAHLSADKNLMQAFNNNEDIHQATAATTLGINLEDVTDEQRRRAKAVNFGLIYGMSSFGLAKQLGISRRDAQEYIDAYFARYPGVLNYMEKTRADAHANGYVETLMGRRLYVPNINSKNNALRAASERAAINAPLQGSCADIIKIAMIQLQAWSEQQNNIHLLMQVHDELIFSAADAGHSKAMQHIKQTMEQAYKLKVPLKVDIGVGSNWHVAH